MKQQPSKTALNSTFRFSLGLVSLVFFLSLAEGSVVLAQDNAAFVSKRRTIEAKETGLSIPSGLTFSSRANAFLVVERSRPDERPTGETGITKITPFGQRMNVARIVGAISDPINMAFDEKNGRLLFFQSAGNKLIDLLEGPDGSLDPRTLILHNAKPFGLKNPQGMTVDPETGDLFILDAVGPKIVRIEPNPDGRFGKARMMELDLRPTGLVEVRGLAFDPTTGHLHVLSVGEQMLYELSTAGEVVATRDLSGLELRDPQSMVFAPSGDLTDDPSEMSLYIADSGTSSSLQNNAAGPVPGGIVELTFTEPMAVETSTFQSSLIQTIDTSLWVPPSPDPSGIVYLPTPDRLLVSDGEVNEMTIFTGDNLYETDRTGNLIKTWTTIPFSDEPTGVTFNPSNNHLFFSDDTGTRRVYELNPGTDGLYGTSDDIITSFKTGDFGSKDPEGVTVANLQGADVLFIIDGVNREVYRVHPGGNGIFDGVPPAGDDQVTHFDTLSLGLDDPEGICFNPDSGTLYAVGKPSGTLFEITTDGALVQTIDISAANARKPSGLAYGPSSQNPSQMSIYIAARGVDNDSDPNENDGKIYEMSLPLPMNSPPVAVDDSTSTAEDAPVPIAVVANDSDPDGNLDPNSANTTSGPSNGTLVNNGGGTFTYTPNTDFNGSDSFIYEICDTFGACDTATVNVTVSSVPDPPVAVDDSASTSENTAETIDVAANDSDPDGNLNPASANTTSGPSNGTLVNNRDGSFIYTPNAGFHGDDSFVYQICDTGALCDTATVTITVSPWNDPPSAVDDDASTAEDTPVTIDVAANDSDPDGNLDPNSANTTSGPSNGTLVNNGGGSFGYTPNTDFNGSDSFIYEICDTFGGCDTATVNVSVSSVADPPVAVDDSASTAENTAVTIGVAANDTDPDGDLIPASANSTCTSCSGPANGILANTGDGTFTYTPNTDFNGSDSFIYEICDTFGACDTATVTITVSPSNDPPVAVDDSASTEEDTAVIIDVAENDTDPDGNLNPASANTTCTTGCSEPGNGSLNNNGNGTFEYSPNAGFSGNDSFVYIICDTLGACDTATVTITVSSVPDPPVAVDDSASTPENTAVTIDVAENDTDPDGNLNPASANTTSGPSNGTLVNNGDGTFTYTPNAGFNGSDSFIYEICDTGALCDTATVTITVNSSDPVTVSFQDGIGGYAGTRDSKLMSSTPDVNFGNATNLEIDGSPDISSVLYWDVSGIPSGRVIQSVDVTLYITNASTHFYNFFRVLRPWVEGEVTWNSYASGESWQVPGANGSQDRGSTVLGNISGSKGSAIFTLNEDGVAVVQSWVDDPTFNHGFILLNYGASDGLDFSSRENATVSRRPKLTITYR